MRHFITITAAAILALTISTASVSRAGDLNPPPGPVGPTMVTLDQIFNAVGSGMSPSASRTAILKVPGVMGESLPIPGPDSLPGGFIPVLGLEGGKISVPTGGGGGGVGAPMLEPFHVLTPLEASTPELMEIVAKGLHINFVEIEIREQDSVGAQRIRAVIRLEDVRFTASEVHFIDGTVQYSIVGFKELQVTYHIFDQNGPTGQTVEFCFNFVLNAGC